MQTRVTKRISTYDLSYSPGVAASTVFWHQRIKKIILNEFLSQKYVLQTTPKIDVKCKLGKFQSSQCTNQINHHDIEEYRTVHTLPRSTIQETNETKPEEALHSKMTGWSQICYPWRQGNQVWTENQNARNTAIWNSCNSILQANWRLCDWPWPSVSTLSIKKPL